MTVPTDTAGSYRRLLAVPALRGLAVADACARLPQGMVTVTLLLVAATHASMVTAGLVVTGYSLGQAVTGPARGRLADRRGLAVVSAACGAGYALALLGLLAGSMAGAPAWLLVSTAAAAGLSCPPLSPGLRSLWSASAAGPLRQAAFALDAALFDLSYIAGPVVASSLVTGVSPAAAVVTLLVLTGVATIIISKRPASRRQPGTATGAGAPRRLLGPLHSAALRRLLLTGVLANLALAGTEVALTGYVRLHHALWAAGPLLAELSVGSILGSLLLGARAPGDESRRLPRLLGLYAIGLAALAAAALQPPLVALVAPLAGLCLGPSLATLFNLASSATSGEEATETQAWLNSAMNGGAAAGAALAGAVLTRPGTSGPPLALAILAGAAGIAALNCYIAACCRNPNASVRYVPRLRDRRKEATVGDVPHPTARAHDRDPDLAEPDRVPRGTGPAR